jgi:imidazolonepropionase-like amidohydrolase
MKMSRIIRTVLVVSVFVMSCFLLANSCQVIPTEMPEVTAYRTGSLALTHVNVIDVSAGVVIPDQVVHVVDDTILAIGDFGTVALPPGCTEIDVTGKYLVPGYSDMHTHVIDDEDLLLLVANGVTQIRNCADLPDWVKSMFAIPDIRFLRDQVNSGRIPGPMIVTAGHVLDGANPISPYNAVVKTPGKGREWVHSTRDGGYDYVKVYDNLTIATFDAILDEAYAQSIPVFGHVPKAVGLDHYLKSGAVSIEHMTGYINNDKGDFDISESQLDYYAGLTAASGIWNCPTLTIWDRIPPQNGFEQVFTFPESKYLSSMVAWQWQTSLPYYYKVDYEGEDYIEQMRRLTMRMVKVLYDNGCRLVIGTDMNVIGTFPGFSIHREMELFVEAGIPERETLAAATIEAAHCLGLEAKYGSIEAGKAANMVLLNANPLDDITNTQSIESVLVNGNRFTREDLDTLLEYVEIKNANGR